MPNRILHESIKYCPKMEQLNWFEEVVYHRLTVSVDDYGCLDGRIVLLKNTLFPTREDISKDDIARAIEHMVALGLLRAYEAGGMPYLHFPAWEEEQRVRNKRRKFPAPPDAARDEEEPLAAEDSLSAADGGALFAGEKHLTASCCQLTAGCPPESNPYPNPYPYPDSNPKFESGSVTNPYPIQAPGACAEERPRAGEQSLLLYKSPKTEAASRGAGQLIAKVVQWKGNGLTDHPKSFALATESVSQPSIVQRSICAGRVPSGTLESANR